VGQHGVLCEVKTESVALRKRPYYQYRTEKVTDVTITNIPQSLLRIMVEKERWHR